MDKQRVIAHVSCLLNRGAATPAETALFTNRPHDKLVDCFIQYLTHHQQFLPDMHLERSHALNEKGVDLLLMAYGTTRIGFQLKSHFDVMQPQFAADVKRQLAESQTHGLDKYYILICSPLTHDGEDYGHTISHLVNELSAMKTDYHCAYGPASVVRLFDGSSPLTAEDFNARIKQYTYQPTDRGKLIEELYEKLIGDPAPVAPAGAVEHDKKQFTEADALMSEMNLEAVLNDLYDDDKFRVEPFSKLEAFHHYFGYQANRFVSAELQALNDRLRESLVKLFRFTMDNFHAFPTNQVERYCLEPSLNIDRSVEVPPGGRVKYGGLQEMLHAIVAEIDERYKAYRKRAKELFAV